MSNRLEFKSQKNWDAPNFSNHHIIGAHNPRIGLMGTVETHVTLFDGD